MITKPFEMLLVLVFVLSPSAFAQVLVPATSEDIEEFDRQVLAQEHKGKSGLELKSEVVKEAKELVDRPRGRDKDFGKWVKGQQKKNEQGRASLTGSPSRNSGAHQGHSGGSGKKDKKN